MTHTDDHSSTFWTLAFVLFFASFSVQAQKVISLRVYPAESLEIQGIVGDTTETYAILVNEGTASIRIFDSWFRSGTGGVFLTGSDINTRLDPGEYTILRLLFIPVDTGFVSDQLQLLLNDNLTLDTMEVPVRGYTSGSCTSTLHIVPGSLDISSQFIGDEYEAFFRLENHSKDTIRITSLNVIDAQSPAFTITEHPDQMIPPSGETYVSVLASSVSPGQRWCMLQIRTSCGYTATAVVSVSWQWNWPRIEIRSDPLYIGEVMLTQHCNRALRIYSTGTMPLVVYNISIEGADSLDFDIAFQDSITISPGRYREVDVTFHPSVLGVRKAKLHIATNDPVNPTTVVNMHGSGVEYRQPDIAVDKDLISFGLVFIGYPETDSVMIYNRGNAVLRIDEIEHKEFGGWEYSKCQLEIFPRAPLTIPPNDSRALFITSNPTHISEARSYVVLHSDDPDSPEISIVVGERGRYPFIAASEPAQLVFASVPLNDSLDAVLRIIDAGERSNNVWVWGQEIYGPDASHFQIIDSIPERTNQSTGEATIRYHQGERGSHIAFFRIQCFDPATPVFEVPLLGFDDGTTVVGDAPHPAVHALAVYPNPFSTGTTISFSLSNPGTIQLDLVDISGRTVFTRSLLLSAPGKYALPLEARNITPGLYHLRFSCENQVMTKALIRLPD